MWSENDAYFDYVEIRRRIERRLSSGTWFLMHVGVYMAGLVSILAAFSVMSWGTISWLNFGMAGWSGLLVLHGLLEMQQSGLSNRRRLTAVQNELEDRLEAGDTELLSNSRGVFRLQSLLEEDVRQRAGWVITLTAFAFAHMAFWGISLFSNLTHGGLWFMMTLFSMAALAGVYGVNKGRRYLRDRSLERSLMSHPRRQQAAIKHKRSFDADLEAYSRLTDDGELVDAPPDWAAYQRNRKA